MRVPTINVQRRSSLFSTPVIETDGPISGWCHNYRFTCLDYLVEARNPRRPIKCHNMASGHTRDFFSSTATTGCRHLLIWFLAELFFLLYFVVFNFYRVVSFKGEGMNLSIAIFRIGEGSKTN